MTIEEAVKKYQTFACLDCGVCTGSCPVSRVLPSFSPRLIVEKALLELGDELLEDRELTRLWLEDLRYYRACNGFGLRVPPDFFALAHFARSQDRVAGASIEPAPAR